MFRPLPCDSPRRAGQIKGRYNHPLPGFWSGLMCRQRYRYGFEIRRDDQNRFVTLSLQIPAFQEDITFIPGRERNVSVRESDGRRGALYRQTGMRITSIAQS